jgi:copper chaperone NosL
MVLMDTKFGAELVTAKGRVLKFDDVNCMISYLNAEVKDDRDVRFKLVTDFTRQGSLIDANTAFYVKSSEIKSPMASQVAAFENYDVMGTYKKDLDGIYLTWGELVTQFK